MNTNYKRVPTRFGPETRFEVKPVPPAPFRATQETELERLKNKLLLRLLNDLNEPAAEARVKGVLCEKAMATLLAEADAMLAACKRAGARLLIDHPRRFHPTFQLVRQALQEGQIGRLRAIVATIGGAVVHNGTHIFDLVRYFGGDALSVSAHVVPSAGGDGDGACQIQLANGVSAFVALHGGLPFSVDLLGTDGRITIDASVEGATLWRCDQPLLSDLPGAAAPAVGDPAGQSKPWYKGSKWPSKVFTFALPGSPGFFPLAINSP